MSNSVPDITFTPVKAEHYPLLREWLGRPHVREWWGEPETELGFIRDMVEGRDTTRPFLIEVEGEPVGYIQYWFIRDNRSEETMKSEPWVAELPEEAVGVDLTIGVEGLLSKGIGSAAVAAFARMLREQGFETIIIDPDPENRRAVRAYEKAGFRPIPRLEGHTDGVLIMQYDEKNEIIL